MIKYFPVVRSSYAASDAVQQSLSRKLLDLKLANSNKTLDKEKLPMAILGYEMEPTYTFGRRQRGHMPPALRAHLENNCRNAKVVETLRGGFATFHGPGQLVLYPVLDLNSLGVKVRDYVCILEKSIVSLLQNNYGIAAEQRPGTGLNGVWISGKESKIASVGVHIRRNVTTHGLALNVDMDTFWFQQIVPCNLPNATMTSISEVAPSTNKGAETSSMVAKVGEQLAEEIARRLGVTLSFQTPGASHQLLTNATSA